MGWHPAAGVWHATCIFLGGLSIGFFLNDAVAKDLLRLAAWVAGLLLGGAGCRLWQS